MKIEEPDLFSRYFKKNKFLDLSGFRFINMKTSFKIQGTLVSLKTYDYQIPVFPGMAVVLNQKYYTVERAVLSLDKDEVVVIVNRSVTDPQ